MEKYATYNYYKNKETGVIKKVALHDVIDLEGSFSEELKKHGSKQDNVWIKIDNLLEIEKIENTK